MSDKKRVLVISGEVWQDGTNGGNVLTGMFTGCDFEFAQIYCREGKPKNSICKKYYQMNDKMVFKSFLLHKPIGREFSLEDEDEKEVCENNLTVSKSDKKVYSFFHNHRLNLFFAIRHLLWNLSNWKNDKLKKFIDEFNPDIIFAPCYADKFKLRLTRFVAKYTNKKIISYISDDGYSFKQFNFSPIFWIEKIGVRHQMRKTFPLYSLCYTMTEVQKAQCEKIFNANMKILLKPVDVVGSAKEIVNEPIRIVYAGGIYLNRYKTLSKLALAIKKVNNGESKYKLDIYTSNSISKKIDKLLNDKINSEIHKAVSSKELFEIYSNSDIALHVESFDLKNRLAVRMSFSTKITDCLSSGCAVMAICDSKQGGFDYLKTNDLAICIDNLRAIESTLTDIVNDKNIILDYSNKALNFAMVKHNAEKIREEIKQDFIEILNDESVAD